MEDYPMSVENILKTIKDEDVQFVDIRFTDTKGKEQHVSVPARVVDEDFFKDGKMFDGSSIAGWKGIHESDMTLLPDPDTAVMDPFYEERTLNIRCDVVEPTTGEGYARCPRSAAKRAEAYLKSSGVGDAAYFGPEPEFFIFDDVRWGVEMKGAFYAIESEESSWASARVFEDGNIGHRPGIKGGYFPVPPVDSMQDIRSTMCLIMDEMGLETEVHHHEVATAGQAEIGTKFDTLVRRAAVIFRANFAALVFFDIAARLDPGFAQAGQAEVDIDHGLRVGVGARGVVNRDRRFVGGLVQGDLAHRHADVFMNFACDVNLLRGG